MRSPPTSMITGTSPTGTLVKLRQPRMPCSLRLRRRFDGSSAAIGRLSSTRQSTRTHSVDP